MDRQRPGTTPARTRPVEGLPDPIVKDGFIEVWDRSGMGLEFNVEKARAHLKAEDAGFFD